MQAGLVAQPNQPVTYTKVGVSRLADAWRRSEPTVGPRFVRYFANFFTSIQNDNTRRAYAYAILEFWDWYESVYGRAPTPDRIERKDALHYAEWLRTRSRNITDYRLHRDPGRVFETAIYDIVGQSPGVGIEQIRRQLLLRPEFTMVDPKGQRVLAIEHENPDGLDVFLACLVEKTKTLTRTPTVEELRRRHPQLMNTLHVRIDPAVFRYAQRRPTDARGVERSSTIAARLSALSALWDYLRTSTGENMPEFAFSKPLLEHNIWTEPLQAAAELAPSHKAATRARKTPDQEIFDRILATTRRSEETLGRIAAFEDVRDRAILLFLYWTGVRSDELGRLTRADIYGNPPVVSVLGKGGKQRGFAIPPPAADALVELTGKIEALATAAERRAPGSVPRMTTLLDDRAPLFPAVARWGCNARSPRARAEAEQGLTRQGIAMMLRRRAVEAGFAPGSEEFARVHPHGFRHLAALSAADRGVPVHVIQAALGHASLGTTGIYVEQRDPRSVSLYGAHVPPAAPPAAQAPAAPQESALAPPRQTTAAPRPAPSKASQPIVRPPKAHSPPRRPQIIETTAVEVPPPSTAIEPPAPVESPIVAVGQGKLPKEHDVVREPPSALGTVYESQNWGEKGSRRKFGPGTGVLSQVLVGNDTGLPWWLGPSGNLAPAMPLVAPEQFASCNPEDQTALCKGVVALWEKWLNDPSKGPTAAFALLAWLRDMLRVSTEIDEWLGLRGRWVPFDAPLALTKSDKNFLRMHEDAAILRWLETVGWQHRMSQGREGKAGKARESHVLDTPPELPAYYAEEDPVLSLPEPARQELFDWLRALTGQAPKDRTPRYQGASRAGIAEVLGLFCLYDDAVQTLAKVRRGLLDKREKPEAEATQRTVLQALPLVLARVTGGKVKELPLDKLVKERVDSYKKVLLAREKERGLDEAAAAAEVESVIEKMEVGDGAPKARGRNRDFYMRLVGKIFGKEASEDEILRIYALCARTAPLARELGLTTTYYADKRAAAGSYANLFRIAEGTIRHTPDFQRAFAQATGTHSECVARRMARDLWEMRKMDQRPDVLLSWADAMTAMRVPCPAAQEGELKGRLGSTSPVPVYEEWLRATQRGESTLSEAEEEFAAAAEQRGLGSRIGREGSPAEAARSGTAGMTKFVSNPRARAHVYKPNRLLPPPPVLLILLGLR